MSFDKQVFETCKACYFHIRALRHICAAAIVGSRLNFCNSFLAGTSISNLTRLHLSSQNMYQREHSALLRLCQCVFPHVKPSWQPPSRFHLLLQISGMHCQIICRPFQLFLLLEELSNIISCLLTLTVVQNLVRSNQLNVSHFVIQRQLLPSEHLRLVEVINFA